MCLLSNILTIMLFRLGILLEVAMVAQGPMCTFSFGRFCQSVFPTSHASLYSYQQNVQLHVFANNWYCLCFFLIVLFFHIISPIMSRSWPSLLMHSQDMQPLQTAGGQGALRGNRGTQMYWWDSVKLLQGKVC